MTRTGRTAGTGGTDGDATTDEVRLRPGRADEAGALSDLALRSKGHWGYDAAFLDACRAELTLCSDQAARTTVAFVGATMTGFVLLTGLPAGEGLEVSGAGELSMLFVDPPFIGRGVGRLLLTAAVEAAVTRGWSRLRIEADPGAEPFYVAAGARPVGTVASGSVAGRRLPLLELAVGAGPSNRSATLRSRRRSS